MIGRRGFITGAAVAGIVCGLFYEAGKAQGWSDGQSDVRMHTVVKRDDGHQFFGECLTEGRPDGPRGYSIFCATDSRLKGRR